VGGRASSARQAGNIPVPGFLCHAPGATGGTKSTLLTGKGHELLMGAFGATQAQKTMDQYAAFEKGIELFFDEIG